MKPSATVGSTAKGKNTTAIHSSRSLLRAEKKASGPRKTSRTWPDSKKKKGWQSQAEQKSKEPRTTADGKHLTIRNRQWWCLRISWRLSKKTKRHTIFTALWAEAAFSPSACSYRQPKSLNREKRDSRSCWKCWEMEKNQNDKFFHSLTHNNSLTGNISLKSSNFFYLRSS